MAMGSATWKAVKQEHGAESRLPQSGQELRIPPAAQPGAELTESTRPGF